MIGRLIEWVKDRRTAKDTAERAERGDVEAQLALGKLYENGTGVGRDEEKAKQWYLKAAQTGHIGAQMALGRLHFQGPPFSEDYREAMKWYRKAAEKGSAWGQHELAWMYCTVLPYYNKGVTDFAAGIEWYRRSAQQGNVSSMNALARMYNEGIGTPKDYVEAMKWYKMAHDHGDKNAMWYVKRILAQPGFAYAQAAKWYGENDLSQ